MHLPFLRAQKTRHFFRKQCRKAQISEFQLTSEGNYCCLKEFWEKQTKSPLKGRILRIISSLQYGSSKKPAKCKPGNATALRRKGNLSLTDWIMVLLQFIALPPVPLWPSKLGGISRERG